MLNIHLRIGTKYESPCNDYNGSTRYPHFSRSNAPLSVSINSVQIIYRKNKSLYRKKHICIYIYMYCLDHEIYERKYRY
jgi:hypothetical protein